MSNPNHYAEHVSDLYFMTLKKKVKFDKWML